MDLTVLTVLAALVSITGPAVMGYEVCERFHDGRFTYCDEGTCCGDDSFCCVDGVCVVDACLAVGAIVGIVIGCLFALGLLIFLCVSIAGKVCMKDSRVVVPVT